MSAAVQHQGDDLRDRRHGRLGRRVPDPGSDTIRRGGPAAAGPERRAGKRSVHRQDNRRPGGELPLDLRRQARAARLLGHLVRPLHRRAAEPDEGLRKFHDQGFEVLGISLDQPDAGRRSPRSRGRRTCRGGRSTTASTGRPRSPTSTSIDSIPRAYLVDGDTGEILATGSSLRGERLERTLAETLGKKGLLKKSPE